MTCFNKQDAKGNQWPGYLTLDVTGGWYDAGDQGKYVVNGGISVWTLMNLYEQEQLAKEGDKSAFADGKVKIPEQHNGYNDLLDESRWMMEFFLAMQVPEGKKAWVPVGDQSKQLDSLKLTEIDASGMVFHKVADEAWTGMPLPPHKDPTTPFPEPPQHGCDSEPGGHRPPVRSRMEESGSGLRTAQPAGSGTSLEGGQPPSGRLCL